MFCRHWPNSVYWSHSTKLINYGWCSNLLLVLIHLLECDWHLHYLPDQLDSTKTLLLSTHLMQYYSSYFLTIYWSACNVYAKNSMRSRWLLIQLSFSNYPLVVTLPHILEHLLSCSDITLAESVNVDALGDAFSDFKVLIIRVDKII